MNTMDNARFARLMLAVSEVYSKGMSDGLVDIYWKCLQRFEINEIENAFAKHLNNADTGSFMPKPADIVKQIEGGSEGRALGAWSLVERGLRQVGGYDSVVFDDELTQAVISDMGGWIKLCSGQADEMPFKANEFQKRYRAYVITPPVSVPSVLVGRTEMQNSENGFKLPPPVFLGDKAKAEAIYKSAKKQKNLIHRSGDKIKQATIHVLQKAVDQK